MPLSVLDRLALLRDHRQMRMLLVALVVSCAPIAACQDATRSGPDASAAPPPVHELAGRTLLTGPRHTDGVNYVRISGRLGLNRQMCFTVDGDILVTNYDASIVEKGHAIDFPGLGVKRLGDQVNGLGGYYDEVGIDGSEKCRSRPRLAAQTQEQFVGMRTGP